jgi:hypothetical protein
VFGVAPVLIATYCLPFTANVAGKPVTCEPKFTSQSTVPVAASYARKRPAVSPPNNSPLAVVMSDVWPARCSRFQAVRPVSTEMASIVPTFVSPGAI